MWVRDRERLGLGFKLNFYERFRFDRFSRILEVRKTRVCEIDGDTDGEAKAGVCEGGAAETGNKRSHSDGEGSQLEAGEDGEQPGRPVIGACGCSPHPHRRVPRWRRNWNHSLHRP